MAACAEGAGKGDAAYDAADNGGGDSSSNSKKCRNAVSDVLERLVGQRVALWGQHDEVELVRALYAVHLGVRL